MSVTGSPRLGKVTCSEPTNGDCGHPVGLVAADADDASCGCPETALPW